jgi:hypothetical protein
VSASLNTEKYFSFFYKTSHLNEELNCTESSPFERVPWAEYTRYKLNQGHYYKTLLIRNVQKIDILHSKLVCLSKPVKVTDNNKDISLLPIKFDNSKL